MATTTNLGITKPTVGASLDSWGTEINAGTDAIDAVFKADGTGTSVGLNVGSGKTLAVAGTLNVTGTLSGGVVAPLASPTFTGTPAAPTAASGTNNTQLATTAFVIGERSSTATLTNKTLTDAVANTQSVGNITTKVATTAFVAAASTPSVIVSDRTFSNTSLSAGSGFNVVDINSLDVNSISASLASSEVTLPAGTYYCEVIMQCAPSDVSGAIVISGLYASSTEIAKLGSCYVAPNGSGDMTQSTMVSTAVFTLASSTAISLKAQASGLYSAMVLGPTNTGYTSTIIKLWKTA